MTNAKQHVIDPVLIKAYRQAEYEVQANPQHYILRIGEVNHALVEQMKKEQVTTAAYLTAFNPYGQQIGLEENQRAQKQLLVDLDLLSIHYLQGQGRDAAGVWPSEPSVLALGITLQDAEILADRYGQNAFVWISNLDGFVSLRLRYPIAIPSAQEITEWINRLPDHLQTHAKIVNPSELAWIMAVRDQDLEHWLSPDSWDLNQTWPIAGPDGSAMGVGTELDRMFRLIAAGVQSLI